MATICKGICTGKQIKGIKNNLKYELGYKRCTFCGIFMDTDNLRCSCCGSMLRTKSRTGYKNQN